MQLILSTTYTKEKLGAAWWSQFYKARYLRLLPIYLAAFSLVVGAHLFIQTASPFWSWSYLSALSDTWQNLFFKAFIILTNLTMFFQDAVMYMAVQSGQIVWTGHFRNFEVPLWPALAIPQAWSLGIELSFYSIAPFLLNLRSRWLILGMCTGLIVKVAAIESLHLGDPWTYRFFPFELGYFLLGAVSFRFRALLECPGLNPRIGRLCAYPLAIGLIAFSVPVRLSTLWYPTVVACLLPFLFKTTSKLKVDRLIGELSYPFYVFHIFALVVAERLGRHWLHSSDYSIAWVGLGLTLMLSIIGLAIEIRFVEPWRVRFAERREEPVSRSELPATKARTHEISPYSAVEASPPPGAIY